MLTSHVIKQKQSLQKHILGKHSKILKQYLVIFVREGLLTHSTIVRGDRHVSLDKLSCLNVDLASFKLHE